MALGLGFCLGLGVAHDGLPVTPSMSIWIWDQVDVKVDFGPPSIRTTLPTHHSHVWACCVGGFFASISSAIADGSPRNRVKKYWVLLGDRHIMFNNYQNITFNFVFYCLLNNKKNKIIHWINPWSLKLCCFALYMRRSHRFILAK